MGYAVSVGTVCNIKKEIDNPTCRISVNQLQVQKHGIILFGGTSSEKVDAIGNSHTQCEMATR